MAHDVFVSHSAKDKAAANRVCEALEAEGIKCWIAPRDILPAQIWAEAIVDAIGSSAVMVAVLSRNANESEQIKREIERADDSGAALVPLFVEQFTPSKYLEYYIGNTHWFDASTPPLESHLPRLAQAIRRLIEQRREKEREKGAGAAVAPEPLPETFVQPVARPQVTDHVPVKTTDGRRSSQKWIIISVAAALVLAVVAGLYAYTRDNEQPRRPPENAPVANPSPAAPAPTPNRKLAEAKEREGFLNLIDGKYDQAIAAFKEADRAFPQFRSVFDVARLLEKNRAALDDPEKRKEIFTTIVTTFQVPDDLRAKLRALSSEAPAPPLPRPTRRVLIDPAIRPGVVNRNGD